ncbi:hypothetical protein Taro_017682 [Colocasia esculenta]|uniref:Uncharacterized protein n=1 Tax=Colocasia esculenta TaxID=4460 RepID=A0A843UNS0_COLES|nr:hypothetical protein [Colocasia esculenta]
MPSSEFLDAVDPKRCRGSLPHCPNYLLVVVDGWNQLQMVGFKLAKENRDMHVSEKVNGMKTMASRGRRGGASASEDEPRRGKRAEQQAPAPPGPVLPPPPPVDYGVFMQGLVQAMQTQAHTQAALQAQLEAQAQAPAQDHGGPPIMEQFKRMTLPSFKGESDPLMAESWLRETEKIFRAIRCPDEDKVTLATYMLQPSLWTRLVAFDHHTLDDALSAACRQEGEMEQYLEEKKASQKRPAATFQRQDKKKMVYQTPQRSVTVSNSQMKDYDAILGLDWLEEHYVLVDCRRKRIVFRIPGEDEFSHPLLRNWAGKMVISAMKSQKFRKQGSSPIVELSPTALRAILSPSFYCNWRLEGSSRKASPTFPYCGYHPGARRKEILEDVSALLGTAQGELLRAFRSVGAIF